MSVNLNLKRPIVFIKVSTTGINPQRDRIVELSLVKIDLERKVHKVNKLINPNMPIPIQATAIHGITDEMVGDKPLFSAISRDIFSFVDGCDFAGYNIEEFDLRFLIEEFNKSSIGFTLYGKSIVNISNMYHTLNPKDLHAAYKQYCGKDIEGDFIPTEQHNIIAAQILNGMMTTHNGKTYKDRKTGEHTLEATPEYLSSNFRKHKKALDLEGKIVLNNEDRPIFNFGQFKGMLVYDAMLKDPDYVNWISTESEIPADSKKLIQDIVRKASKNMVKQ